MTIAGTGDLYTPTRKIQEATKGRETDVLDALNIDWRKGNPHITCPYPTHGGKADWRWDAKTSRARCTCTKGDSIFDVTMKVASVDFEAAKMRVAELLGRTDLILPRGAHQPMNAGALFRPPADRRADTLPRAYLAHRLGVDREQAPAPATPVAGWHKLPYFDPPASARSKPILIGHFPCVAFGTIAADGRSHAHRSMSPKAAPAKPNSAKAATRRNRRPRLAGIRTRPAAPCCGAIESALSGRSFVKASRPAQPSRSHSVLRSTPASC